MVYTHRLHHEMIMFELHISETLSYIPFYLKKKTTLKYQDISAHSHDTILPSFLFSKILDSRRCIKYVVQLVFFSPFKES